MFYVIMAGLLVTGFFVINGIGKVALESYANHKASAKLASIVSYLSLAIWYIFSYVILTLIAFHINDFIGWIFAVLWGIGTIVVGLGKLGKDNRHSMNLAHERRLENLRK